MFSVSSMIHNITSEDKILCQEDAGKFANDFITKIPLDDVQGIPAADLALIIKDHWQMHQSRKLGDINVKIKTGTYATPKNGSGYKHRSGTMIDIICDDMAFTINSLASELTRRGYKLERFFHPRLISEQDSKKAQKADLNDRRRFAVSHIHILLNTILDDHETAILHDVVTEILTDVALSNRDWQDMLAVLGDTIETLGKKPCGDDAEKDMISEYQSFLTYLHNDNFTLLGTCEFDLTAKKDVGSPKADTLRGVLSQDRKASYFDFADEGFPLWNNIGNTEKSSLIVIKLKRLASVHRVVPLDAVSVVLFDDKGKAICERVFVGLFTSVTYSRSIQDVPYLRRKANMIVEKSGFIPASHDYKALRHILEKFPRDELFQISEKDLAQTSMDIMRLHQQPQIALFTRNNPYNNLFTCLVYFPKDQFDSRIRMRVQKMLEEALDGKTQNFFTTMDDLALARVVFIISTKKQIDKSWDIEALEAEIIEQCRAWKDRFAQACDMNFDEQEYSDSIIHRYEHAFPPEYEERVEPKHALFDVMKIEQAFADEHGLSFDIYKGPGQTANQFQLKIFQIRQQIPLSDILPVIENLGLRVMSERPYEVVVGPDQTPVWLHDFKMELSRKDTEIDLDKVKPLVEEALHRILVGDMESDGLNRLLFLSEMNWRQVVVLRSYIRYLHQIRYGFSPRYMAQAITENPKISRLIVDYFAARHDPSNIGDKKKTAENQKKIDQILADLETSFDAVESLDHDRILRRITAVVTATLRTNFFQLDGDGRTKTYLSLKLNSREVPDLPNPRPYREIFVYSPHMEGIHLRGDKIARGGIRWSDRPEDFRTEILGLMKAQLVKNSIIVPMGAKGGFIIKKDMRQASRQETQDQAIFCYKILVRGLLDITDNLVDDKIVPPKNVVRLDKDDPYLVVAADKGTATFSDIANEISQEYGFWLDDAFASGGAAGYDHKKMGITARGAWESVKRHFQELNHNTQTQPFDVIGVGDMGGDVFGNGMLLSKQIRLVAAFNHRHIFIDPDPNPQTSWEERKRLFDSVSGWEGYNQKLLSQGGAIFDRNEKSLPLSAEIKKRFGLSVDHITPAELMHVLLKAQTDLLWFGGIGTYVKASSESHSDVGDKANDTIRINADELRAKVIGEGANLAVTQKARIEASLRGVRCNADFIDNSGGVDCSDHEVNIKILMTDIRKNKQLSLADRNKMLESMTQEVAGLVLRNNYQQALGVSLMEMLSFRNINQYREFISDLEKEGLFQRDQIGLPSDEEISVRVNQGNGLTRPEVAIIQAYAKIVFTQGLLNSDIPDSENMQTYLARYFPDMLQKKYGTEIARHSLRREIISTEIANGLINRMGPTFVKNRMNKTGASSDMVAKAYIIAREAFQLRDLWDKIEGLDFQVPAMVQLKAMRDISELVERQVSWLLTRLGREPDLDQDIDWLQNGVQALKTSIHDVVTPKMRDNMDVAMRNARQEGLPDYLVEDVAMVLILSSACDIVHIAKSAKEDILTAAQVYFEIGEFFQLEWLRNQARFMGGDDIWASEAKEGIIDQLFTCQSGIATKLLLDTKKQKNAKDKFTSWKDQNRKVDQIRNVVQDMRRASGMDLAKLIIAEQRLRSIFGG